MSKIPIFCSFAICEKERTCAESIVPKDRASWLNLIFTSSGKVDFLTKPRRSIWGLLIKSNQRVSCTGGWPSHPCEFRDSCHRQPRIQSVLRHERFMTAEEASPIEGMDFMLVVKP